MAARLDWNDFDDDDEPELLRAYIRRELLPAAEGGDRDAAELLGELLDHFDVLAAPATRARWRARAGVSRRNGRPNVPNDEASARTLRRRSSVG